MLLKLAAYRGAEVWGGGNPPPKFRRPSKIVPNSTRLWKLLKIAKCRTPTPQDVRNKGSKSLKLPPVRNCFTLAMTSKLVVIVNSFKVTKIKKILLYEMKFLVPNYSCFQNPWLGGYRPQIPFLSVLCPLSSTEFVEPLPPNKIPGYATGRNLQKNKLRMNELLSSLKLHFQRKRKRINFTTPLSPLHTSPPCDHLWKQWTVMHFLPT